MYTTVVDALEHPFPPCRESLNKLHNLKLMLVGLGRRYQMIQQQCRA